jgi:hypothetical protein
MDERTKFGGTDWPNLGENYKYWNPSKIQSQGRIHRTYPTESSEIKELEKNEEDDAWLPEQEGRVRVGREIKVTGEMKARAALAECLSGQKYVACHTEE